MFFFSDRHEEHKLGRGRCDLASCQVSLNFVQQFQRRSRNVSTNHRRGRSSCSSDRPEKHKLGRGHWVCWILFSSFRGEFENLSVNQRQGRPSCFFWSARKTQTCQRTLRSCFLSSFVECRPAVLEEKSKMFQPIRGQDGHLVFRSVWKTHTIIWQRTLSVEILLPVPVVSLNFVQQFQRRSRKCLSQYRQGRPSYSSDRPEKHKLGRGRWDLASCQVSLKSVERFQRRSRKCLSQSKTRAVILGFFFRSARKTQTWQRT